MLVVGVCVWVSKYVFNEVLVVTGCGIMLKLTIRMSIE